MTNLNPYDVLGISRDATQEEIDAAFRNKAKSAHPDAGGSSEEFHAIKGSHLILRDPERRKKYDKTGQFEEKPIDDGDARSWVYLAMVFSKITGDLAFDPFKIDLIEHIKGKIEEELGILRKQLANVAAAANRVERLRKRFKKKSRKAGKGGKVNMLDGIFITQLRDLQQGIDGLTMDKTTRERAIELLGEYDFEADAMPKSGISITAYSLRDLAEEEARRSRANFFRFNIT